MRFLGGADAGASVDLRFLPVVEATFRDAVVVRCVPDLRWAF